MEKINKNKNISDQTILKIILILLAFNLCAFGILLKDQTEDIFEIFNINNSNYQELNQLTEEFIDITSQKMISRFDTYITGAPEEYSNVITMINTGDKVEAIAENNKWYKVIFDNKDGYILKEYLAPDYNFLGGIGKIDYITSGVIHNSTIPENLTDEYWHNLKYGEVYGDDF